MAGNTHSQNFDQTVLPHLDAAYNLGRWLMRNEHDAEDAVQEAYLRAFRFFPLFRGGDARAWLLKIVRNACYSQLRANRPMQEATEFDENVAPPDSCAPNPEEALLQHDGGNLVRRALDALPLGFREVVILREFEGMSYKEIADITGLPTGTVMSRLSRARGRLRQALTGLMNEGGARRPEQVKSSRVHFHVSESVGLTREDESLGPVDGRQRVLYRHRDAASEKRCLALSADS
jgi:RNA polymerase sigma-70 factor (ECF subfamily)